MWVCPSHVNPFDNGAEGYYMSYGYNLIGTDADFNDGWGLYTWTSLLTRKANTFRDSSGTLALVDANWDYVNGVDKIDASRSPSGYRHQKGVNILFTDGHAAWMKGPIIQEMLSMKPIKGTL